MGNLETLSINMLYYNKKIARYEDKVPTYLWAEDTKFSLLFLPQPPPLPSFPFSHPHGSVGCVGHAHCLRPCSATGGPLKESSINDLYICNSLLLSLKLGSVISYPFGPLPPPPFSPCRRYMYGDPPDTAPTHNRPTSIQITKCGWLREDCIRE